MLRVDIARMEIQHEGMASGVGHRYESPLDRKWQRPQIESPAERNPQPPEFHHGRGYLEHLVAAPGGDATRMRGGISHAVHVVLHRKDARIVQESFFAYDVQRPRIFFGYR